MFRAKGREDSEAAVPEEEGEEERGSLSEGSGDGAPNNGGGDVAV